MDTLDDSENNAKISDSAYSNSCSNSQSRRSHSSKSTHSGSNSSGSSGYGGKPSTSGSSDQQQEKRNKEKEPKKKKQPQTENVIPQPPPEEESGPVEPVQVVKTPKEEIIINEVDQTPSPQLAQDENGPESMDVAVEDRLSVIDEVVSCNISTVNTMNLVPCRSTSSACSEGFSCVISMDDGVIMYTTSSLTAMLGFPKDMWIGRSFIDFVHPRDRNTFASQITSGLAVPKTVNAQSPGSSVSTIVCRIRRYRGLNSGFGVKEHGVKFMPFLLKLTFKNVNEKDGKIIYLVIRATPFVSAFKVPNETVTKAVPFVMRHSANGYIDYIDPESVPYLGYLPQDLTNKDALPLYHPEDLVYLRQMYETVVKQGGMPRSKPYRMMTYNGDYIKVETEWSSFINPWSRKLEFVSAKIFIVEGPSNPDVFHPMESDKVLKLTEEEKIKSHALRESIVRILNEVLTKPAEVAKQQMSKRCQDLAVFMENLLEEQPKADEDLRLKIQDQDNSYYERDSVMLGGISPHHDNNDSQSSTETPLSYNQLNYNENLQRYFDSHQPFRSEDFIFGPGGYIVTEKITHPLTSCLSPLATISGDSVEMNSSCGSNPDLMPISCAPTLSGFQQVRLTEAIINKHNAEMEKELMKIHRELSCSTKGEREKISKENRKKRKEHLARCNATFQPTAAGTPSVAETPRSRKSIQNRHGIKRSKQLDFEESSHKHHCSSTRTTRRKQTTSAAAAQCSSTITTTVAANHWTPNPMNNMNTFILGVGLPQQMSIIRPVLPQQMPTMTAVPGMFPMYYAPAESAPALASSSSNVDASKNTGPYPAQAMQCMMYGQTVYGSPFVYSPITPHVSYPMQQTMMPQPMQCTNTTSPLGLTSSNYEEACKPSLHLRSSKLGNWRDKKPTESQGTTSKMGQGNVDSLYSSNTLNRASGAHSSDSQSGNEKSAKSSEPRCPSDSPKSTDMVLDTGDSGSRSEKSKSTRAAINSDENVDRMDGESSYSSFYSSFFKTESGSAEESGDAKKTPKIRFWDRNRRGEDQSSGEATSSLYEPRQSKKVAKRKIEPPWLEQVCVTSDLMYKYQVLPKSMNEVLISDKEKITSIEQPSLVNEQLGQLYVDLQLEGVASRLTLEEGITSSSSSGEETLTTTPKAPRRKREYSKLVMIYEEDAPLPSPPEGDAVVGSSEDMQPEMNQK
ncbi:period circadian protein isoform X2 [Galleria mellonella]|uniref:Period circadian protein n=2 Tax=Galleria mellonella TaxID=7137 RepID=A0A6J3C481_GALME|nr:period circadian protein isoform X2 [Galleria mellonella]